MKMAKFPELDEHSLSLLVEILTPRGMLRDIKPLKGSFSNSTCFVQLETREGQLLNLAVRRYAIFGDYDRGEKARREYQTLELIQKHGIPAPRPVYLDDKGSVLGTPGIVTTYIEGTQVVVPSKPARWVREMATMLASIHSIHCSGETFDFLLDADSEAIWFLNKGKIPDAMRMVSGGEIVWNQVRDLVSQKIPVQKSLVHIDYSPGNILWKQEKISAVLDWEEAACGDPAIDVAYLYVNLFLTAPTTELAGQFVDAYQAEIGKEMENLKLWKLAAAVRFMPDPATIVPELKSLGNIQCTPETVRARLTELIQKLVQP